MHNAVRMSFIAVILVGTWLNTLFAISEKGHYVPGVEGIKAASLPPPGVYFRWYHAFYGANTLKDGNGDKLNIDFKVNVYAMANRLIWITDKKFLGANFGMDVLVPFIRTDLKIGAMGLADNKFSLGDIYFEPFLLSWHGPLYDAGFGVGFYAPTGQYDKTKPASAGQDFWTTMITFGVTRYFDTAKTWSFSILDRYEINSEKSETKVKPGQDFLFEWGLAKNVRKFWDFGLSGYYLWQVTGDSGADVYWDTKVHDRVFSLGPEASVFIMKAKAFLSLRTQWEFAARDRTEGHITTITFTKIF